MKCASVIGLVSWGLFAFCPLVLIFAILTEDRQTFRGQIIGLCQCITQRVKSDRLDLEVAPFTSFLEQIEKIGWQSNVESFLFLRTNHAPFSH